MFQLTNKFTIPQNQSFSSANIRPLGSPAATGKDLSDPIPNHHQFLQPSFMQPKQQMPPRFRSRGRGRPAVVEQEEPFSVKLVENQNDHGLNGSMENLSIVSGSSSCKNRESGRNHGAGAGHKKPAPKMVAKQEHLDAEGKILKCYQTGMFRLTVAENSVNRCFCHNRNRLFTSKKTETET